jgi:hypothetical protein
MIYMSWPRQTLKLASSNMANSTDEKAWNDILQGRIPPGQADFSTGARTLDEMSFLDIDDLGEARDWFSSPENNMPSIAEMVDNPRRRPSIQNSPPKVLNEPFSASRQPNQAYVMYISRSEFHHTLRDITDKLSKLQDR